MTRLIGELADCSRSRIFELVEVFPEEVMRVKARATIHVLLHGSHHWWRTCSMFELLGASSAASRPTAQQNLDIIRRLWKVVLNLLLRNEPRTTGPTRRRMI